MLNEKLRKVANSFYCETCHYKCSRKSSYDKHLSTRKHKMLIDAKKYPQKFICECGKSYKQMPSLSRHRKTCTFINKEKEEYEEKDENGNFVDKQMFMELMKVVVKQGEQQSEFMKEVIPKIGNTINNTNCNNTTNNNKFNMNIFLNETCKDAMPLVEFINNLNLSVEDLDNAGKEGLVKGITDIITKGLNKLDVTKRPIHCSDIKRETLYIKEDNKWVKDDKDKTIVTDAIGLVKREADNFFPQWLEEHPNCWEQESPYHEQYMIMVKNRFGGGDDDIFIEKNTKKVIKNIAKEVIVDKDINEIE